MSDIDGRACALELYLGKEASIDEKGQLRPVRWGGFNDKMARYQGQIVGKGEIRKRFEEALAHVRLGQTENEHFDFTGVEAIFDRVFDVLAEDPTPPGAASRIGSPRAAGGDI